MTTTKTLVGAPEPPGHQPIKIYSDMLAALGNITHLTWVLSERAEPSTKAALEAIATETVERVIRSGVQR